MIIDVAGFTEAGPRPHNEDCYAFWWVGDAFFAAVADGLGGMGGGARASDYVISLARRVVSEATSSAIDLVEIAKSAHEGLVDLQKEKAELRSMATTLTLVGVRSNRLFASHCGDTRLYLARGNGIRRLSEDHSEGARLFREGLISKHELSNYPRKHILDSALGVRGAPTIQAIEFNLMPSDWLILSSDGAYLRMASSEIRDLCKAGHGASAFVQTARSLIDERGAADNYTMIAAHLQ